MCKIIADAKNIIDQVTYEENITVEDIFYYGTKKIEYGLLYNDIIISVSLVDNLAYDFTVFTFYDEELGEVIYNNTQILSSLDELYDVLRTDIKKRKGECI